MNTNRCKILFVVTIFFFVCSGCFHANYSKRGDIAEPYEKSAVLTIAELNLPDTDVVIEKIDQQSFSEDQTIQKNHFILTPGEHTIIYCYYKHISTSKTPNNLGSGGRFGGFKVIRRVKIFSPEDFNISFSAKAGHAYDLKSFAKFEDSQDAEIDIIDLLTIINDVTEGNIVALDSIGKGGFEKEIPLQTGLELKRENEKIHYEKRNIRDSEIESASVCGNEYCEDNETHSDCPEDCFPVDIKPDNISNNDKLVYLDFIFKGQKSGIYFSVNHNIYEEIASLPRYIISKANKNKNNTKRDFILTRLNNKLQRENLLPLVQKIKALTPDVDKQARIAISLVQNIPYAFPSARTFHNVYHNKYPYEVVYENRGVCSEKADLLLFILRELGFGTATLIYKEENHRTVGIKCSDAYDAGDSGYCYVEVTEPKIVTDSLSKYKGVGDLTDFEVIKISNGKELEGIEEEFADRNLYYELIKKAKAQNGILEQNDYDRYNAILSKYGMEKF